MNINRLSREREREVSDSFLLYFAGWTIFFHRIMMWEKLSDPKHSPVLSRGIPWKMTREISVSFYWPQSRFCWCGWFFEFFTYLFSIKRQNKLITVNKFSHSLKRTLLSVIMDIFRQRACVREFHHGFLLDIIDSPVISCSSPGSPIDIFEWRFLHDSKENHLSRNNHFPFLRIEFVWCWWHYLFCRK